ncbi:MAG: inositol monophosphatase family protein [Bdellovibrionia bacterium]
MKSKRKQPQKFPKSPPLNQIAATAVQAAHAAGAVLAKHYGRKLKIREKLGAGLVTNADLEAEDAALRILKRKFPDFGTLTEESPPEMPRDHGRWILDPLDGTTNFVHGFPMFCVSLAAEWSGQLVVGVVYHPIFKETYLAIKGKGAKVNGVKMKVSTTSKISDSLLTTGFTYRRNEILHQEMEAFERLSGIARAIRRPGSAALDLAYTARGVFDGFWERKLSPWDMAAGALLVQEAGGIVTDFKSNPFQPEFREILASTPHLHSQLLQAVAPEYCQLPPPGTSISD